MSPRTWVRTCSIVIDAFVARFLALPDEHARHTHVLWMRALLAHGLLGAHAAAAVHLAGGGLRQDHAP